MKPSTSDFVAIKGRITEGLKESGLFTHIPWVREQFIRKLGIAPYPGTLKLDVLDSHEREKLREFERGKGIEILPAEPGFCSAKCFHALICGRVKGAIVIPQVPDYPESKLEVISSKSIRDVLSLEVGDLVTVEIYYYDKGKNGLSKKDVSREETQLH